MLILLPTIFLLLGQQSNNQTTADSFTSKADSVFKPKIDTAIDLRDGQKYATVTIGNLKWFKQNLNYKTEQSVCYEDSMIKCGRWGRLYNINEMPTACPPGWRIPNLDDWKQLKPYIDSLSVFALMNPSHWKNNENASNKTELSLVPSGFKHKKKFYLQYINTSIWFNDTTDIGSHWHFHADGNNNKQPYYFHNHADEVFKRWFAIRCVCDL